MCEKSEDMLIWTNVKKAKETQTSSANGALLSYTQPYTYTLIILLPQLLGHKVGIGHLGQQTQAIRSAAAEENGLQKLF